MSTTSQFLYAPNVSWLFPELPFALRPKAIADLGFEAIEFGFPSHSDLSALEEARETLGLEIVLFNQDIPVWDAAHRGYLADPQRREEFHRKLDESLDLVRRLGVHKVMLPAGAELPDAGRQAQRACMVENLSYAAPRAAEAGALLTVEVLNPRDNPGYFLTSTEEACDIVREVDHPNVRYQLDTYHIRLMGGDPAEVIRRDRGWIGHIQLADFPGRHEPGTGQTDFEAIEAAIQAAGYQGYIGLEYVPQAQGAAALAWVPAARRRGGNKASTSQGRRK
jgi:hydroxypyruvate isomerase